ncbi:hypothetical protein WJX82_004180 [Trebouxia sp. C0006]
MRAQADNDGWLNYLPSALTTLRTVTLLSTSFLCAAVACLGGTLLFYILLSRIFSPAAAHHERSLYFDYTKADAIATAHFLPESQYNRAYNSEAAASQTRFLSSRQRFDVWLELATPEAHGQEGDEVFQVVGRLLTADGSVAGESSRPVLVKQRYWLSRTIRLLFNAPFVILGLWDERREVQVPLFSSYQEQPDKPFVMFQATLQARAGGGRLPQLYEAKVHLRLRLGIVSRLLFLTRLGNWVTWILIATSLLSIFGGTAGSIAFALLWVFTRGAVSNAARPTGNYGLPEEEHDLNGDISDDDDPASPKGIREAVLDFEDAAIGQENVTRRKTGGVASSVNDDSPPLWSDAQKPHSSGSYPQLYAGPKKLS